MTRRVDVLVVGLGPAGASAAAAAARAGWSVLAIDRKRVAGRPVQCAELVPRLLGAEVDAVVRSVRQPITAMRTFVEDDAADVQAPFPGWMLDRAQFDAALVERAREVGADCRLGTGLRAHDAAGARLVLSDGTLVNARVVIGADGPRSIVGRAIGQSNAALVETRQISVALHAPQESTDIFLSASIPGGYGWLFPKGLRANLGAGVFASHRLALKRIVTDLHRALLERGVVGARAAGLTGGAIPVGGPLRPAGTLGRTLVLLAGDAAGLANPITGAGIAAAVQSGRLAGEAAAAHLAGKGNAPRNYAEELDATFGPSLARALRHRRELEAGWQAPPGPSKAALRRAWIAYPEYWSSPVPAAPMEAVS